MGRTNLPPGEKLSNAEKCRRYKEKKKAANLQKFKEDNRAAVKKHRSKMSQEDKELYRQKDNQHKRESRKRKKVGKEQTVIEYRTNAAMGKAKAKVDRALPENPLRAKAVLEASLASINKQIGPIETEIITPPHRKHGLSESTINQVTKFYYRQDISMEFPGHKDYVRVKQTDGSFKKMTKHVLVMTVRECFAQFQLDHPDVELNVSKFYSLRPPNVLLRHKMPQNVCTCIYHENINYLIAGLHKHNPDFPVDHSALIRAITCQAENVMNEKCQFGECGVCNSLNTLENLFNMIGSDSTLLQSWFIKYYRWEKQSTEGVDRIRKVEKYNSLRNVLELLHEDLPYFKIHRFVKRNQDDRFNQLHGRMDSNSLLLQFDFSENAEIVEQDEIQSAHWWHLQVSLFTACAWVNREKNCFAVVTDYKNHDKYLSLLCVLRVLNQLLSKYPDVKNLNLFSDGAAQHFKQCFFLTGVTELNSLLGLDKDSLKITYDLFATSHGKGAVDGIGGTVKRQVRSQIMSRKETVSRAEDFATVAQKVCPNISVMYISKEEVMNSKTVFDEIFDGCKTLPGTRRAHHFAVADRFEMIYKSYAFSEQEKKFRFK